MRNPFFKKPLEVFVVILLLYTNLFMGYFTRNHLSGGSITIQGILIDLATPQIFIIALIGAVISYLILEYIVKK